MGERVPYFSCVNTSFARRLSKVWQKHKGELKEIPNSGAFLAQLLCNECKHYGACDQTKLKSPGPLSSVEVVPDASIETVWPGETISCLTIFICGSANMSTSVVLDSSKYLLPVWVFCWVSWRRGKKCN